MCGLAAHALADLTERAMPAPSGDPDRHSGGGCSRWRVHADVAILPSVRAGETIAAGVSRRGKSEHHGAGCRV